MMVFGALTAPLGPVEPILRDVLARSVARDSRENMDEVIGEIERGEATAWVISEDATIYGAVVTKLVGENPPQLFIWHLGGHGFREWSHFISLLQQWARQCGCDSIEYHGRPGIRRILGAGWEDVAVVVRNML